MRNITYNQVEEAVAEKRIHVLEYQGDDIVDVTNLMIGIKNGSDQCGDDTQINVLLRRPDRGEFEQVMAHSVYTGKGIALFVEDTLGTLGVSYTAV